MNIKRGRPKKNLDDVVDELTGKEESKPVHVAGDNLSFKNKVFVYKDGSRCTVMYSTCKDKPIEIKVL